MQLFKAVMLQQNHMVHIYVKSQTVYSKESNTKLRNVRRFIHACWYSSINNRGQVFQLMSHICIEFISEQTEFRWKMPQLQPLETYSTMHVLSLEQETVNISRMVVYTNGALLYNLREQMFSRKLCWYLYAPLKRNIVQRKSKLSCWYLEIFSLRSES